MKSLNKALSLFLCIVLFLNMVPIVQGTGVSSEDLAIVSFTVPVISNEYTNDYVTIYEHEGKFFMSLNDIGDFTRSTLTEDDETLTLTHGLREVVITKSDGHMVDSGIVDQGNISLLEYNGMYLCEGIPMLQYLGAACSIHEEKELEVLMPIYTIWESIMPDYLDYYFDINELYGGENSVKISLICDILADVLDGVSGHGLFGSYDIHMEDALYEVLNVDMMKYSSVQQSAAEENQKINDFLTSDIYGFILDGSEKTVDGVYEVLDYYAGFYLNTEIWKNSYLEKLYFEAGDLKSASELGSQINKQVYTQSVMQADLKDVKANKSLLSIGMLAFDTAVTSYGLMQYDDDTRNLFARTISDEMIAHTNYHRAGWMSVSDKIANTLKSTESIVVNTAATKIAETAVDEVTKYGVQKAISGLTTKGNIYVAAAQIGFYLASLINHSSNEAYSADLNAILLNEAHFDIAMMASQLLVDERDKHHFSDPESLERIKDMFTLYYRFVIAFSENVAKSVDEFGGRDDQKWVDWFSSTEEASVANYAAAYLYRITNCVIVPIVVYSEIDYEIITHDWISTITAEHGNSMLEKYDTFISVIESVQTYINYDMFPSSQKEYCRGNFFETNGNQAMALMYFVSDTTDMEPGYYVGLWIEHTDGTISCLTNKLIEEAHNPDDAYVTVTIRQIADKEYLNPYIRTTKNSTDISKNQYYSIGDELVSEYYLYSESPFIAMEDGLIQHDESNSVFYLNQKPIDRSTYYATQDKLNIGTFLLEINANWSEGLPPQGYTFEELLDQLNGNNSSEYNDEFTTLTATLGYSSDSAKAILNTFIPFCRTLSNTYISSKGDTAKQRSCLVVEFEPGIPNLVVHYWDPNGDSPGEFCETWIIYGIENGKITELFCDENYSPTRRDIAMVYDESYRFALREEQTGGYYELIIHYPDNTTEKGLYENYKYIYLPEDEHFLRVWTLSGSYLDIPF